MSHSSNFTPGTQVKVIRGTLAGRRGVVFDHTKEPHRLLPPPERVYWVAISVDGKEMTCIMDEDEIEVVSA
jgi:hypothetical protein